MAPQSWLKVSHDSPFSMSNIPFGCGIVPGSEAASVLVAIGGYGLDLAKFASSGGFSSLEEIQHSLEVFQKSTLNAFAKLGKPITGNVRKYLQEVLAVDTPYPHILKNDGDLQRECLVALGDIQMQLPFEIGSFSDFYGGMNHAYNAGALFRGQNGALLPNYLHLPMAYHSRTSTIYVSGTPIRRPWGQIVEDMTAKDKGPIFTPCRTMDFELELGAFVCGSNEPFSNIPISEAEKHIFGFVLLNDWSARDIQRWEYVPLGPFNGKNFATTISAWVVLADALEPFRKAGMKNPGKLLPYLRESREDSTYDLRLEVDLVSNRTKQCTRICSTNASDGLVWSFPQMLAHHTITGCVMRDGDLLGSGTISGTTRTSLGCLLEQTENGKEALSLKGGERRIWLEDGDEVILKASAGDQETGLVGFGDAAGVVLPAREPQL